MNNKWVRKAVEDALDGMVINTISVPVYDVAATAYDGKFYVLLSTQNKDLVPNKCGDGWDYFLLIDIVSRYRKNTGVRVMGDDIEEEVRSRLASIQLDVAAGVRINNIRYNEEADLFDQFGSEHIHRKLLRYQFAIQ